MAEKTERSSTRVRGFQDPEMDFQLLRQLGACVYGGGSIGECLYAASQIKDETAATWSKVFMEVGKRQEKDADRRASRGHGVSAREQYLRASNSYRASEYFLDMKSPMHRRAGLRSRECFMKSMDLCDYHFEIVDIPFESMMMKAYFISPDKGRKKRRTIMIISGFDGTLEETYCGGGRAALERGYNLLLFAGPGQMDIYRFYDAIPFRPDYEKPISAAVSWLLRRREVDASRLALMGISLGGYFVVRAAAFERRICALIPNSPIVDLHAYMSGVAGMDPADFPDDLAMGRRDLERPDEIADPEVRNRIMSMPPSLRANALAVMFRFGQKSVKAAFQYMKKFRVSPGELHGIECPALALAGAGEGGEAERQFALFCGGISGPVTKHLFTLEEGADAHCQVNNMGLCCAVVYDWLDELFA
jgi:pimeloyl-ACP methyl ester carboxylesterase